MVYHSKYHLSNLLTAEISSSSTSSNFILINTQSNLLHSSPQISCRVEGLSNYGSEGDYTHPRRTVTIIILKPGKVISDLQNSIVFFLFSLLNTTFLANNCLSFICNLTSIKSDTNLPQFSINIFQITQMLTILCSIIKESRKKLLVWMFIRAPTNHSHTK